MQELRNAGRTILFVSHNMQAVTRLCKRAIYLSQGRIIDDGPAQQVASTYLTARLQATAERVWENPSDAPANDIARLRAVRVRREDGRVIDVADIRERLGVEMEFDVLSEGHVLVPNLHFYNEEGVLAFALHDSDPEWRRRPRPVGRYTSTAWIPGNFLSEGTLIVGAAVSTHSPVVVHFYEPEAVVFQVVDSLEGETARGDYEGPMAGIVRPLLPWSTRFEPGVGLAPTPKAAAASLVKEVAP
jgi:lipopolysaccharide transport system ATP-binding protein